NVFLQVEPDATLRQPPVSGLFARTAPRLGGALAFSGWRWESFYALDYRRVEGAGNLLRHEAELSLATPRLALFRPRLAVSVGRFDADLYPTDRFLFAAGELGVR